MRSQTRPENVNTDIHAGVIVLSPPRDDGLDCFEPEAKADDQSRPRRQSIHDEASRRHSLRVIRGRRQERGFWQRGPVFGWSVFLSVFTCGIFIGALLARPVTPSTPQIKGVAAAPRPVPVPSSPAATPPAVVRAERGTGSEVAPDGDTGAGRGPSQIIHSQRPRVVVPLHSGTLIVTSTPRGASVYLNNKLAGETPLVMRGLAAGSRAVRVDLDGYTRWSRGIQVVADQATTISARLDRSE